MLSPSLLGSWHQQRTTEVCASFAAFKVKGHDDVHYLEQITNITSIKTSGVILSSSVASFLAGLATYIKAVRADPRGICHREFQVSCQCRFNIVKCVEFSTTTYVLHSEGLKLFVCVTAVCIGQDVSDNDFPWN